MSDASLPQPDHAPAQPTDDRLLVASAQRGDPGAMAQLLRAYQSQIYRISLGILGHHHDAEEATQDVLVKIIQSLGQFKGQSRFSTWLTRVVRNHCISAIRKRDVRSSLSLDQGSASSRANQADGMDQADPLRQRLADTREPSPDQRVQQDEQQAHLLAALNDMEDSFREILILRDMESMEYAEIAQVLDINLGTVKSRLFRARLALRQKLMTDDGSAPRPATMES